MSVRFLQTHTAARSQKLLQDSVSTRNLQDPPLGCTQVRDGGTSFPTRARVPEAPKSVATRLLVESPRRWEAQGRHRLQHDPPSRVRAPAGPHGPPPPTPALRCTSAAWAPGQRCPAPVPRSEALARGPGALNNVQAAMPTARHALAHSSCGDRTSGHAHNTHSLSRSLAKTDRSAVWGDALRLQPMNPPRSFTLLGNKKEALTHQSRSTRTKNFYKTK